MTTNYKILGQTAPAATTETLVYAVPSSNSALVRSINITNTSSTTADVVNVGLVNTSSNTMVNANYIMYQETIPAAATVTIKSGYTMSASNGIRVYSTNGTCTFSAFGAEIS
jgi:hypothetical protein